jgi:LysR family nitrogen assimilation transcriptional regulator
MHGVLAGAVALGLPPSMTRLLAVPLLRAFREQFPRAKLSITEGLSLSMQEWLRSGRLDVALLYGPPKSDDLEGEYLMDEPLFAISPRLETDAAPGSAEDAAPISLAELAACPLVMPSRPNALRMLLERYMIDAGHKPRVEVEVDGVTAILELVLEGIGLAVLPPHAVRSVAHPERYMARPIGPPWVREQVWLVSSARRARTLTQQALIELLGALTPRLAQGSAAR